MNGLYVRQNSMTLNRESDKMKEIAINEIEKQIRFYEQKLGKYASLVMTEDQMAFIKGIIFGLEQALISVKNS